MIDLARGIVTQAGYLAVSGAGVVAAQAPAPELPSSLLGLLIFIVVALVSLNVWMVKSVFKELERSRREREALHAACDQRTIDERTAFVQALKDLRAEFEKRSQ